MAWTASAATKRLSWSWTTKRRKTRAAIPETTARKALILGGCRRTHVATAWIGLLVGFITGLSLSLSVSLFLSVRFLMRCVLFRLRNLRFVSGNLDFRSEKKTHDPFHGPSGIPRVDLPIHLVLTRVKCWWAGYRYCCPFNKLGYWFLFPLFFSYKRFQGLIIYFNYGNVFFFFNETIAISFYNIHGFKYSVI